MTDQIKPTALFQFDEHSELEAVFLNARSDEEEEKLKEAIAQLIKPGVWESFARFLTGKVR
jgi:hypothetical protein